MRFGFLLSDPPGTWVFERQVVEPRTFVVIGMFKTVLLCGLLAGMIGLVAAWLAWKVFNRVERAFVHNNKTFCRNGIAWLTGMAYVAITEVLIILLVVMPYKGWLSGLVIDGFS